MVAGLTEKTLPSKTLRRITAYLHPDLYKELENEATGDKRTISQMASILIDEAIQARKAKVQKEKE